MEGNELLEVLKYTSPNELYVVDENKLLVKLECPFVVRVLINIGALNKGDFVEVDQVKVTECFITVFCIGDTLYWYYYFDIV